MITLHDEVILPRPNHIKHIATQLGLAPEQVHAVLRLAEQGATVPFISRYRKEHTGSLDEVQIRAILKEAEKQAVLEKRRKAILSSLEERALLNPALRKALLEADSLSSLEDLYLPFRPKRRTRATVAREKGLEPLAKLLFQQKVHADPIEEARAYIQPDKGVGTIEEALQGARDIIAEWINEDGKARRQMRRLFIEQGRIQSRVMRGKKEAGAKFRDYFEWNEAIKRIPSHRFLALMRGESEKILSVKIAPEETDAITRLERLFIKGRGSATKQVRQAIQDGYKRLLSSSMETEVRDWAKARADEAAITVFSDNLRQLLMAPPLGQKRVMAIDPGFRTGCKVVCLDSQGALLEHTTIFPHPPQRQSLRAEAVLMDLWERHEIEAIGIGNGTAGRETEDFVKSLDLPATVMVVSVDESGASIYSASDLAREEFPDKDVTVRGAISIGRRLMDPLAELVKIDPKSIGVGQYQHDVHQSALRQSLDDTVMSCVNAVGVEVNTASPQLLTYVSGLGPALAKQIVSYREQHGPFRTREQLKSVPRLGPKAYEQAAGFLRIQNGDNPLDASAVHPESYAIVERMARDISTDISSLMQRVDLAKHIRLEKLSNGDDRTSHP